MTNPLDWTLRGLTACGGCAGTQAQTPAAVLNRPGLGAVAFRAGTHASFKASLLAGLSDARRPALGYLRTRETDDFTIGLLDGFAALADVLTFYSERIANEAFLRTATERRSVLELARAIGYELDPGVAASTCLAFTVEDAPGAPGYAELPSRTQVQSLPGPGEKPQTFETLKPLLARKEWNVLRPLAQRIPVPFHGMRQLRLRGVATGLKPGDALLAIGAERKRDSGNENWDFRRVSALATFPNADPAKAYTLVTLDRELGSEVPWQNPATDTAQVFALRARTALFGHNAPDWRAMPDSVRQGFLQYSVAPPPAGPGNAPALIEWPGLTIADISDGPPADAVGTGLLGEYFDTLDFRERRFRRTDATVDFDWHAGAPDPRIAADTFSVRWTGWIRPVTTGEHTFVTESDDGVRLWVDGRLIIDNWTLHGRTRDQATIRLEAGRDYDVKLEFFENGGAALIRLLWSYPGQAEQVIPATRLHPRDVHTVHLESVQTGIVPGSWLVVATPDYEEVYEVVSAVEDARANFTLTAKTTRLTLRGENLREKFNENVREVSVFAQAEPLDWSAEPVFTAVAGSEIVLDQAVPELPAGRELLLSGQPARVRVTRAGAPLVVKVPGGADQPLKIGDVLTVLEAPVPDAGGLLWKVELPSKLRGSVHATAQQLAWTAADSSVAPVFEVVTVKRSEITSYGRTRVVLEAPLDRAYDPGTVTIYGNAAFATHGETVKEEILGSGNAGQPHQQFLLREKPVTFTPAATVTGSESSLEVWVNDVRWTEVPSLYPCGPNDRVFVTRRLDDGSSVVQFGDGRRGSRLPTGVENVRALYRKGIGRGSLVKAEQLSLLMTRPLGLRSVVNPQASEGAADAQSLEDARLNAPFTVLTLGRVVSLQDYEDFARTFAGIAKAHAEWAWTPRGRGVLVTVAAPAGAPFAADSTTLANLAATLKDQGNPLVPVRVVAGAVTTFLLAGAITAGADRRLEIVQTEVHQALRTRFQFDARRFGQTLALSEVLETIHAVAGVAAVRLTQLRFAGRPGAKDPLNPLLVARRPKPGTDLDTAAPAEILVLAESSLADLKVTIA